jgi:hypothetical protein
MVPELLNNKYLIINYGINKADFYSVLNIRSSFVEKIVSVDFHMESNT